MSLLRHRSCRAVDVDISDVYTVVFTPRIMSAGRNAGLTSSAADAIQPNLTDSQRRGRNHSSSCISSHSADDHGGCVGESDVADRSPDSVVQEFKSSFVRSLVQCIHYSQTLDRRAVVHKGAGTAVIASQSDILWVETVVYSPVVVQAITDVFLATLTL